MSKTTTYTPLNPTELIDTTGMDNDTWLKIREHGLGKLPTDPDYIPYTITGSGASAGSGGGLVIGRARSGRSRSGATSCLSVQLGRCSGEGENQDAGKCDFECGSHGSKF